MELNKEIRDILIEFAMIVQEEKYTNSQVLIRSTYDTFRIQNIVKNLSLSDVSSMFSAKQMEQAYNDGVEAEQQRCGEFDIENYC
jgi:hypothetical protein